MQSFNPDPQPVLLAEGWRAGANLAAAQALRHAHWQRQCAAWLAGPGPRSLDQALRALCEAVLGLLAWPIDLARIQHAQGVRAGLLPRSLLESQRFERQLGQVERLLLGPWRVGDGGAGQRARGLSSSSRTISV